MVGEHQLSQSAAPKSLVHRLSATHVFLLTMSTLSPALSVFVYGGEILKSAGTGAAIAFLAGIVAALIWGVLYGELGAAFPHAGGEYAGITGTLGATVGFVDIAMLVVVYPVSNALTAVGFTTYLRFLWPDIPIQSTAAAAMAVAGLVGILNIRTNVLITGLFLAAELAALVILTGCGLLHPARSLMETVVHPLSVQAGALSPVTAGMIALAAVSASYATVGGNQAINYGEEMIDARRRMGWVVLGACMIGAVFTAGPMIAVILGAPDLAATLGEDAPLSVFLRQRAGPTVASLVSLAVAMAIFNALLAQILQQSRFLFSLSRDRLWTPSLNTLLTAIHPRFESPWMATLAIALVSIPLCFVGEWTLLVMVSGQAVVGLTLVSLATFVGRRRRSTGVGGFRSPLYPLFPLLGLVVAIAFAVADLLDADTGRPSLLLLGGMLLLAWIYLITVLRKRPSGWSIVEPSLLAAQGDGPEQ